MRGRHRGSNGAINKPYRPSESQRIARTTARKVIDLTQDSSEDEAGRGCEAESDKESEEQPDSEEQGGSEDQSESEEQEDSEENWNLDAESQEPDLQELERSQDVWAMLATPGISYAVTGYHHRPWGAGDDFHTVGIFNTEKEAKWAALDHYRRTCEREADGWEYYWQGDPGDKKITLVAKVQDYEVQQETYRGTINKVQHQEKPWSPFITRSDGIHVYVVKDERRLSVRSSEIGNSFSNELLDSRVHKIYREGVAANYAAHKLYESHIPFIVHPKTVIHETGHGLVSIFFVDRDEKMSHLITVEKQELL